MVTYYHGKSYWRVIFFSYNEGVQNSAENVPVEQEDLCWKTKCDIGKDKDKISNGLRVLAFGKQDCK